MMGEGEEEEEEEEEPLECQLLWDENIYAELGPEFRRYSSKLNTD